ncbi:MAG: hypothetical protein ACFE8U_00760 [Candidatus Hermodarchaeota archaeon]
MKLELLPNFLQQLITNVETLVDSRLTDQSRTLPVKVKIRMQNVIITWNIYSTDENDLNFLFKQLTGTINQLLDEIKGEVIHYELNSGKIFDSGVFEFQINLGKTWDIYLYDPEIFIYLRLLLESRIANPQEKWISLDIDLVTDSAWFVD